MTDPTPCGTCGQPHTRCTAHRKSDGQPCGQPKVTGTNVCKMHGGLAPQTRAAGQRRAAEEKARAVLARFGDTEEGTTPHEQIARLINVSAGLVRFYREQCAALKPDALVWNDVEVREDRFGQTVIRKAEVNVWLRLYNEERDRLRRICIDAIGAGLAEREIRLAEQHGALVAEVLRAILADLELTPEQQAKALTSVPRRLREYAPRELPSEN